MGSPALIPKVQKDDWVNLNRVLRKLAFAAFGADAIPSFGSVMFNNLTSTRLTFTDANKVLASVSDLAAWIAGTTNQVNVANDGDGTITLSGPQDIHVGASPSFASLTLTDGPIHLGSGTNYASLAIGPDGDLTIITEDSDGTAGNITLSPDGQVNVTTGLTVGGTDFIVDAANSGVTIGSADGSNYVGLSHDNSDAYFKTDDGAFVFLTDEGTNSNTTIEVKGKGTGEGRIKLYDEDNAEYIQITCVGGSGRIELVGAAPSNLNLMRTALGNIHFFSNAGEGDTKELKIFGRRTGDSRRSLEFSCGIDAADTGSYNGVSNHLFHGTIKSTDGAQLGDGGITDYTQFSGTGIQTMVGAARVEVELGIAVAGTGGGASKPTFDENFSPFDGWRMGIGDDLHYVFEVPANADTSEDIEFHIHWFINEAFATNSGEVNWQIVYRAVREDGTEPVDSGGSTATVTTGDINIPATTKSLLESGGLTIIAANIEQDDVVGIDLSRIAIVDGSDPSASPIITAVEVHYTKNKLGTAL